MRRPECLIIMLLLIVMACDDAGEAGPASDDRDPDEHFSEFASALFLELQKEPLDSALVDIGLFGDLSVTAGERLAMGRYRYRVDRLSHGLVGSMAFQLHDTSRGGEPVWVILTFTRPDDMWTLDRATVGDAASAPPSHPAGEANPHEFDDLLHEQDQASLNESLQRPLDAWVEAAVQRLRTHAVD